MYMKVSWKQTYGNIKDHCNTFSDWILCKNYINVDFGLGHLSIYLFIYSSSLLHLQFGTNSDQEVSIAAIGNYLSQS